jgi:predicted metallopeptidase
LRFWNRHLRFWLISRILMENLSIITPLLKVFQLVVDVFEQFSCTESMKLIVLHGKHSNIDQ